VSKTLTEQSIYCAFAPGKREWKADGNYFTADELKALDLQEDVSLITPAEIIVCAD
jgi:hypothetical protein